MADQLTVIAGEVYLGHWHVATLTDKAPPTILERATWLMEEAEEVEKDAEARLMDEYEAGYTAGYEQACTELESKANA